MVRIRLQRIGRRHLPVYRVNAIDIRAKRDGRVIEQLGQYDPTNKDEGKQFSINAERAQYWLSVGAQPSETVANLLKKAGLNNKPGQASDQVAASA